MEVAAVQEAGAAAEARVAPAAMEAREAVAVPAATEAQVVVDLQAMEAAEVRADGIPLTEAVALRAATGLLAVS